jgi:transcriptional regulator with XRE-family HTH domain
MSTAAKIIGRNVARLRRAQDISQNELGRRIGHANGGYVCMLEQGERMPTVATVLRFARALETDLTTLVRDLDSEAP